MLCGRDVREQPRIAVPYDVRIAERPLIAVDLDRALIDVHGEAVHLEVLPATL